MAELPVNRFKAQIAAGQQQIGIWCCLASPVTAEICAGAGFDWMLFDCEHAPNDSTSVLAQLQAVEPYPGTAMVRPAVGSPTAIKQMLDIGALNLLIPMVDNAEQAKAIAAAAAFPTTGMRGVAAQTRAGRWGRVTGYLQRAREEICVIVQIETAEGLANLAEIASIDGIDAIFIGPADLSASLGFLGQASHPEMQAVIDDAINRLKAIGKPIGIMALEQAAARKYLEQGVSFVAVGMDTMLLADATSRLCEMFDPK